MGARRDNGSIKAALDRSADDRDRRILFTGGAVVTMDPDIGDLERGDVLVEGSRIADVGVDLRASGADAIVIDATGCVVSPGMVDTHRHAWQAQMRRTIPDVEDLTSYLMATLNTVAPIYTPHDMYVGNRLAALTALDSGVTCMLDFSHNARSAEHSEGAIEALVDSGLRAVHASMGPHFGTWHGQWPADLARLRERYFSSDDQLVTLRMAALATDEICGPHVAYAPELAAVARELDIAVSIDGVFGAPSAEAVLRWDRQGLLGPDLTLIHCTSLSREAWQAIGRTGTTVSLAPTSDSQIGLYNAVPPVDESLAVGVRPGLSVDIEVTLVSEMFTQMRTLHAIQRMRAVEATYGTDQAALPRLSTRDVLDFATTQGARTNGLGDVTGSLTPGKQADLLLVRGDDVNNMPLNDAVGTLVLGCDPRNVEAVFVAGQHRKWDGQLVGVDLGRLRDEVYASRDRIVRRAADRAVDTEFTPATARPAVDRSAR